MAKRRANPQSSPKCAPNERTPISGAKLTRPRCAGCVRELAGVVVQDREGAVCWPLTSSALAQRASRARSRSLPESPDDLSALARRECQTAPVPLRGSSVGTPCDVDRVQLDLTPCPRVMCHVLVPSNEARRGAEAARRSPGSHGHRAAAPLCLQRRLIAPLRPLTVLSSATGGERAFGLATRCQ